MNKRNSLHSVGLFERFLYFTISLIYLETVSKLFTLESLTFKGMLFTVLFSVAIALLCTFLCSFWKEKGNRTMAVILTVAIFLLFGLQLVYHRIFNAFFTLYSASEAGNVAQYWREALVGILKSWLPLLLSLIPLVFVCIMSKRVLTPRIHRRGCAGTFIAFVAVQAAATVAVLSSTSGVMTAREVYRGELIPDLSVANFGVMSTYRLDLRNLLFPLDSVEELIDEALPPDSPKAPASPSPSRNPSVPVSEPDSPESPDAAPEIEYNEMAIDFDALAESEENETVAAMHSYFGQQDITNKNEFSGLFEGKNLIWITAEGFSSWALNEEKTPTLCKLADEGFVFNNFYNPVWGVSTSDGEYVPMTGLLPKAGIWSFSESSENDMALSAGNRLGDEGYSCYAYHNHDYTYYNRDKSHPNMGYVYKGNGNGLEVTNSWPESDLEMMELTIPEYIEDDRFHVYYMTVSGHLNYSFEGNAMAYKHRDEVLDLPYSTPCQAYIACNMEFDKAMEYLLQQLEDAGKLEDTVIVVTGDHYPYGLQMSEIEELNGGEVESNFELFRSTCIIWSGSMQAPVQVDKYCSTLDVLPTVLNLMGVEFDSRLLMGSDVFSDAEPLVIFNNRSWITEFGRYDATIDEFIPAEGSEVDEEYARSIVAIVNDKFEFSAKILENDYYAILNLYGENE